MIQILLICMYVCMYVCRYTVNEDLKFMYAACRVKACVSELVSLDLDVRSSAAYGLTHILAALTVTNSELMAKALADKVCLLHSMYVYMYVCMYEDSECIPSYIRILLPTSFVCMYVCTMYV